MKYRLLIWILWPSFLVAGMAEGLLFTIIHPQDLLFFGLDETVIKYNGRKSDEKTGDTLELFFATKKHIKEEG